MVSLTSYFSFWGYFFIFFTLYLFFCVDEDPKAASSTKEKDSCDESDASDEVNPLLSQSSNSSSDLSHITDESQLSVWQTYRLYLDILKNPYVFDSSSIFSLVPSTCIDSSY